MITIAQAVEQVIKRSPFIEEALFEGLINVSALARKIKPDIEYIVKKEIKIGAIVMAINRLSLGDYIRIHSDIQNFLKSLGDILVRSGLNDYTYAYSETLAKKQTTLLKALYNNRDVFCTFSQGVNERTIIISSSFNNEMNKIFKGEQTLSVIENLSSVTIQLPQQNVEIPGVYYYILKKLAWEGINLVEVISTTNEFTLVMKDEEVDRTFSLLMRLKKSGF